MGSRSGPEVYAHRGVRSFLPENTMPGYEAALRIGTDWADMDVVMTRDGEVLVAHDLALNPDLVRDSGGVYLAPSKDELAKWPREKQAAYISRYLIRNLSLEELRQYDVGRLNPQSSYSRFFPDQVAVDGLRMPTLREVIRFVKARTDGSMGFQIEMKTDPLLPGLGADPAAFAAALYRILKEEEIVTRVEVQAFDFACLFALQALDSSIRTAYLTSRDSEKEFYSADHGVATAWTGGKSVKDFNGSIPWMVKELGGANWEPEDVALTRENLELAHGLGLKVVVWSWPEKAGTAFDPAVVARMIEWGVDGIITDDPGRLISMLAARGGMVPKRY